MAIFENLGKALGFGAQDFVSGLAGSASSALLGMAVSDYNSKRMFELNEQAAENAYQRQLDFWNLQNQYNKPSAQMQRLRAAGLNPALMNGIAQNNTAGNLSSVPEGGTSQTPSYAPNPIQQMMPLVSSIKELESAGLLSEETKLTMSKIVSEGLEQYVKQALGAEAWAKANSSILDFVDKFKTFYSNRDVPEMGTYVVPGEAPDVSPTTLSLNEIQSRISEALSRTELNYSNISLNDIAKQVNREHLREVTLNNDLLEIDKQLRQLDLDIKKQFGSLNAFLDAYVKYASGKQSLSSSSYTDGQRDLLYNYYYLELAKLSLDRDRLDTERLQGGGFLGNIINNVLGEGGAVDNALRWLDDNVW